MRSVLANLGEAFNQKVACEEAADLRLKLPRILDVATRVHGYNSRQLNVVLGKHLT